MIRKLSTIVMISFVTVNAIFLSGFSLLAYKIFFDFTSNEISQTRLALLNENTEKVSSFISSVSDVGVYIAANRRVLEIFSDNPDSTYDAIQEQRELTDLSNGVISIKNTIYSVEIYTDRYENYPNISSNVMYPLQTIEQESWLKIFEKMDSGWIPKHTSLINNKKVISYVHRLFDSKGVSVGYLKVNVLANTFFESIGVDDLFSGVNEPLILLNTGGRIINQTSSSTYQDVVDEITRSLPSEPFDVLVDTYNKLSDHHQLLKHDNELYLLLISKPNYDNWSMLQLIPVATLYASTKKLGLIVLFLGICALLLSIPLAYWIGKKIMDPFGEIIQGMKHVERGNFDVKIKPYYIEEYDILSKNFNHMTSQLNESVDNLRQENHYRKEAELRALQSQINPHFLYNTLDMINWKAMDHQAKDISLMVNQLSKMLRISLSGGQKFILLRDELEHVKCYINIQVARLNKDINYQLKVPASVKDCYIPKIILQPFIENSIRHGYPEEDLLPIDIKIVANCYQRLGEEVLEIEIIDQGIGLPADWSMNNLNGIGIKNIQERIWLYCREECKLELFNHQNGGVTVRITLPVIKNQTELNFWMDLQ